ncbi:hypothetical protein ESA_01952 [Cronobacter sakazakii ATCC BAA-894]|uniref:Uncharacterized protein n=1 Tax=Cronobacter sakazakii (strain ATCC BAA-894) TaxID=290339 RepID=A7MMN9_CROS8|nr:hypothetical protein ESA_01952 [Cronobacter sakazakii ATCC BAA-894]
MKLNNVIPPDNVHHRSAKSLPYSLTFIVSLSLDEKPQQKIVRTAPHIEPS